MKGHRKLLESDQLQMSLDFAMLQYQAMVANAMNSNMESSAAAGLRLLGAQEFLATFRLLAESANLPPKPTNRTNLDHSV